MVRTSDLKSWIDAGCRLLERDPSRFLMLLEAAERIVRVYEEEERVQADPGFAYLPSGGAKGSA